PPTLSHQYPETPVTPDNLQLRQIFTNERYSDYSFSDEETSMATTTAGLGSLIDFPVRSRPLGQNPDTRGVTPVPDAWCCSNTEVDKLESYTPQDQPHMDQNASGDWWSSNYSHRAGDVATLCSLNSAALQYSNSLSEPNLAATVSYIPNIAVQRDDASLTDILGKVSAYGVDYPIRSSVQDTMLDLLYDSTLNCYYDPNTGAYYELN
ncbi:hypothetical protein EG68_09208, partial [Paragonimus skrjabini miyazakii]